MARFCYDAINDPRVGPLDGWSVWLRSNGVAFHVDVKHAHTHSTRHVLDLYIVSLFMADDDSTYFLLRFPEARGFLVATEK